MRFLSFLIMTLFLSSCANYINKIHRDLDRADAKQYKQRKKKYDTFNQFRQRPRSNRISTMNRANLAPSVKRKYRPVQEKKRYTADDLTDNTAPASLWAGSGNDNYLFTKNKWKRNGDIVLVNVQGDLKNLITMELKRAFPIMPKRNKGGKKKTPDAGAPGQAQAPAQPEVPADAPQGDEKVHDKVSTVIIEEISKDHLLVRGQKFLLFRNKKHLVELQALIARRDIQDDDTVDSNSFLESTISVLR